MFAGFGLPVWLPQLPAKPHDHLTWCGHGVNLALAGAAGVAAARASSYSPGRPGRRPLA